MNSKNILLPFLAAALCILVQPLLAATFGPLTYLDDGRILVPEYT
jgi:hypothetical protein